MRPWESKQWLGWGCRRSRLIWFNLHQFGTLLLSLSLLGGKTYCRKGKTWIRREGYHCSFPNHQTSSSIIEHHQHNWRQQTLIYSEVPGRFHTCTQCLGSSCSEWRHGSCHRSLAFPQQLQLERCAGNLRYKNHQKPQPHLFRSCNLLHPWSPSSPKPSRSPGAHPMEFVEPKWDRLSIPPWRSQKMACQQSDPLPKNVPSGNDCCSLLWKMVHLVRWFTELKDGDFPWLCGSDPPFCWSQKPLGTALQKNRMEDPA